MLLNVTVGQTWRHGRLVGTPANRKPLVLKRPLLPLDTQRVTKPTHVSHYHIIEMLCYNSTGWIRFFVFSFYINNGIQSHWFRYCTIVLNVKYAGLEAKVFWITMLKGIETKLNSSSRLFFSEMKDPFFF